MGARLSVLVGVAGLAASLSGCSRASHDPPPAVTGAQQFVTDPDGVVGPPLGTGVYRLGDISQRSPAIARGEDGFLIAWRDGSGDVFGARLDSAGALLEGSELLLGRSGPVASGPSIAWGGGTYFVTWIATRGDDSETAIVGSRVQPDGEVLDPGGAALDAAPALDSRPAVTWNGDAFVAAWSDWGTLHVAWFYAEIDGWYHEYALPALGSTALQPALASDGTRTLLLWLDQAGLRGCLLDPGFMPVAGSEFTAPASQVESPSLAMGSSDALAVYGSTAMRIGFDVAGMPVPSGIEINLGSGAIVYSDSVDRSSVVWTGSTYLTAWDALSEWDVELARTVVTNVGPDDALDQMGTYPGLGASIGYSGSEAVLVLEAPRRADAFEIRALNLVQGSATHPLAGTNRTGAAITRAGDSFFGVWRAPGGIQLARIGSDGEVLDPTPTTIATEVDAVDPAVASNGDVQLVVWREGGYDPVDEDSFAWFWAARITLGGELLDDPPLQLSPDFENGFYRNTPAVASDGDAFLAVWLDRPANDLRVARVGASGPVESNQVLASGYDPSVIWTGEHYFVTWATYAGLRSARVSPAGENLDEGSPLVISETGGEHRDPAVAWDGESYLVVYVDARAEDADVRGVHLDGSGKPIGLSDFLVAGGPGMQRDPAVAWDGARFVIGWTDEGSPETSDVRVARYDPPVGELEPPLPAIAETEDREGLPVLVSDGAGKTLLAYAHTNGADPTFTWHMSRFALPAGSADDAGSSPADGDASAAGRSDGGTDAAAPDAPYDDDGLCLCSAPGGSTTSPAPWLAPLGLLATLARRQRRRAA